MGYRFTDLTTACQQDWRAYIEHDFVRQLGTATLPEASFRHYLKQDYLFLIHFARAYALAAYKSPTLTDLRQAHEGLKAIVDVELGLHVGFCQEWGISEQELEALPEARATLAYTRYVLDTGNRGDLLDLHVALAPCLVGYGEIANWLNAQPQPCAARKTHLMPGLPCTKGKSFKPPCNQNLSGSIPDCLTLPLPALPNSVRSSAMPPAWKSTSGRWA